MPSSDENYILIVDDDEGVLGFIDTVLRLEGYRVVAATSGPRAITLAGRWGRDAIGLLITDIMMPEMDGYALAAQFADVPVLYISGFTEKELGARTLRSAAAPLLEKPFSADELRSVVRRILSARAAG